MEMRVSSNGAIVLPEPFREELGIRPGDPVFGMIKAGCLVISKRPPRRRRAKIVTDPITGLPVLTGGPVAPKLTSEMVAEMLADFP